MIRKGLVTLPLLLSLVWLLQPAVASSEPRSPAVGTLISQVDLRALPGAIPYGQGHAIPLRGARPSWFSQQLEQQVLAAGGRPVAAPQDAPLPGEVGIRPGSWEISPFGCTMNFVFRKGATFGIGTAGHCADRTGQHVVLLTLAPGGSNPVLVDVGPVIVRHNNGIGDDFALVSVNPVLNPWVDATEAVVAGPCGQFTGSGVQVVGHYGHGLAIGSGGTPRFGVAATWTSTAYSWDGEAIFGDSGSAVRVADLKAAGDLTHLVVDPKWLPGFIAGTRIGKILQIAAGWSLVNSSLCL